MSTGKVEKKISARKENYYRNLIRNFFRLIWGEFIGVFEAIKVEQSAAYICVK